MNGEPATDPLLTLAEKVFSKLLFSFLIKIDSGLINIITSSPFEKE